MASRRGRPPSDRSQDAAREQREDRHERGSEPERFGAVAIARHVKDDGRALLLYTHAEEHAAACGEREPE
jgi:hypothetical protein